MNRSRMKIVCFLMALIAIIWCCFVGCTNKKTTETSSLSATVATTINSTTEPTTVEPTTEKPTEAIIEESSSVEEEKETPTNNDEVEVEPEEEYNSDVSVDSSSGGAIYSPGEFMNAGVINWGGWTWTYYSERILPGEGLWIPGRWTDSDGYVCDENGYVCLASTSVPRYSVIETPFGRTGKVYDSGCAYGIMDVYVNW